MAASSNMVCASHPSVYLSLRHFNLLLPFDGVFFIKERQRNSLLSFPQIDVSYRMAASSNMVCNCIRNFTAKSKLSLTLMVILLTLALAHLDNPPDFLAPLPQSDNPTDLQAYRCSGYNIINGSALQRNLKVVLNSLVGNVSKTGYSVVSYGQNGDKIYGLANCRGDINASACRTCASNATVTLGEHCEGYSSVTIFLSSCILRYDTHNFYTKLNLSDVSNSTITWCDNTTIKGTDGNARVFKDWNIASLLTTVMQTAVSSNVGFDTGNASGVYTLAQCFRYLDMDQCKQCLNTLYNSLGSCPQGTIQGEALNYNCVTRYARDKFYADGAPLLPAPTGTASGPFQPSRVTEGKSHSRMLGLSIGGAVLVVVIVGVLVIWKLKVLKGSNKKQLPGYYKPLCELSTAISKSKLNYKFKTLQSATKNFDPTNKIGQGGFGSIYKGVIPDGGEIAVKRLFSNKEESVSEFLNEVNLISCVQHKNLVKLLGFSINGPDKLLVYEYLPNKSLDHFIFDENLGNILDWQRRFDIVLGTASGLAYLHQESDIRIIHRDIKASNILLDHHFKPKIADFGLVRYFSEDQTHLSTRIIGTRGYMAPEYLVHGHLTEKVDVYAFGVLILEIISGKRNKTPIHTDDLPSLLSMVWNCHLSGTISNIIDPNIQENYHKEVLQVVHIALLCTQTSAILRPSMSTVIMLLTNKEPNIIEASQPPFIDIDDLQANPNINVISNHSKSHTSIAPNHSHLNTNISISPISKTPNPIANIASSSVTPMSSNTISTSSLKFPR